MNETLRQSVLARVTTCRQVKAAQETSPLYTNPQDVKNYEFRKKIRRAALTALGAWIGAVPGSGIGAAVGSNSGRGALLGALLGAGVGGLGGYGASRLDESYAESAGLDPTLRHLKVKLEKTSAATDVHTKLAALASALRESKR